MKTIAKCDVVINSPIKEVYNYVVNMENYKAWFPGIIDIKSYNNFEHGEVGKKYAETIKVPFSKEKEIIIKVTKAETKKLFITEGEFDPLQPRMVISFYENVDKTVNLNWTFESRTKSRIFSILFLPLIKHDMQKRANKGMFQLKKALENTNK